MDFLWIPYGFDMNVLWLHDCIPIDFLLVHIDSIRVPMDSQCIPYKCPMDSQCIPYSFHMDSLCMDHEVHTDCLLVPRGIPRYVWWIWYGCPIGSSGFYMDSTNSLWVSGLLPMHSPGIPCMFQMDSLYMSYGLLWTPYGFSAHLQ
jgi:hypothetical protein